MNLAGLLSFLINVVGLGIVVGLIFLALDLPVIVIGDPIKKIAKYAVGGAAILAFLVYVAGLLGSGRGTLLNVTPAAIIEFGISFIVLIVLLYIVKVVIEWASPAPKLTEIINFVVGAVAIIVILVLAERALFGGGLGFIQNFNLK
jgi:hypothetical protein